MESRLRPVCVGSLINLNMSQKLKNRMRGSRIAPNGNVEVYFNKDWPGPVHQKTEEEKASILNVLLIQTNILRHQDRQLLEEVVKQFYRKTVAMDVKVVEQGKNVDNFYIVNRGLFHETEGAGHDGLEVVKFYNDEGSFMEKALLYTVTAPTTIVSRNTDGSLWVLNRETYKMAVAYYRHMRHRTTVRLMNQVPVLRLVELERKNRISEALESRYYDAKSVIYSEKDVLDGLYIVITGSVMLYHVSDAGERHPIEGADELIHGHYFGQTAFTWKMGKRRSESAMALEPTTLAFLSVAVFHSQVGDFVTALRRGRLTRVERLRSMIEKPRLLPAGEIVD
ncbi:cAMP-dependent protein kinase R2-like [Tropilaelaps mercedesae]|uniref:cAMP-dependent protein kinase type II-alpha regulatory subunit n=1 Tax=Tropilaelaps mercedesae TaxID=418985 RepID=A0A1V9XAI4_9ACAR|nr:cAMP-dependent protein kinase R2-like [Tropilaelaps mercedesae]